MVFLIHLNQWIVTLWQTYISKSIYMTTYNSSKITAMKWQLNNFMVVEVILTWGTVLKSRSIENIDESKIEFVKFWRLS